MFLRRISQKFLKFLLDTSVCFIVNAPHFSSVELIQTMDNEITCLVIGCLNSFDPTEVRHIKQAVNTDNTI